MSNLILTVTGAGVTLLGVLIVLGIFQPFSGSQTCVGILVGPICLGYYQTVVNGNNFIFGIILTFAGASMFFIGRLVGGTHD